MSARRLAFAATEPFLEEFLAEVEGTSVDVVAAGVLAAAAHHPSTLLGPAIFMVGGAGVGTQWVDGRVRQPGLGAARPRGFLDAPPDTARVGSPRLPAAIHATLAAFGSISATRAATMASRWAKRNNSARAALVERIGRVGNLALTERKEAFLAAVGKATGGLVSEEDLNGSVETHRAEETALDSGWSVHQIVAGEGALHPGHMLHAIVAADGRGTIAVGAYVTAAQGVAISELDLVAPLFATPVVRGETRVTPGTPCALDLPLALVAPAGGAVSLALASTGAPLRSAFEAFDPAQLEQCLRTIPRMVCAHALTAAHPVALRS